MRGMDNTTESEENVEKDPQQIKLTEISGKF